MASSLLFNERENDGCLPSLSYQERIMCFAGCFIFGSFLNMLSFGQITQILLGNPQPFAITFTLGNIVSILGISFLVGFKKQFQNMSDPSRRYTTIIYVVSILGVLITALTIKSKVLVLLFLIVEICAYVWYVASYIPFARDCILKIFQKCFGRS